MISTEEESKKVWCPMARNVYSGGGAAVNTNATCRGSKCKLWEWAADENGADKDSGYCGLSNGIHFIGTLSKTRCRPDKKKETKKADLPI
jgi:hypothetical protein